MAKNKRPAKRSSLSANGDGNGREVNVEGEKIYLNSDVITGTLSNSDFYLGEGYFADVYKFVCPRSERVVALKHLRMVNFKSLKNDKSKSLAKELLREIQVHRDLNHENILKFYGNVENKTSGPYGGIYLVIQYAARDSLTDLMMEKELERTKILVYLEQILKGLHYLHTYENKQGQRQPIVHRDLSCRNVLMMADGTLKIADFGLCKRLNEIAVASGLESQTCNYFWAGPEIISGTKGLPDQTLVLTDIWSFGVLTLELFHYGAHRIPFIHFYKLQMVYAVKLKEGWGPKIPDDVPNELKVLLGRCFQYNIEDRASAGALLELIHQFDSARRVSLPITAQPTPDSEASTPLCSADNTLNEEGTPNDHETDPLARVDDERYLTRLVVPAPLMILIRNDSIEHQQIIKSIAEKELKRYISEDDAVFVLEDKVKIDGTYHIKQKGNDELMFLTRFQSDSKILSIRSARKPNQSIFTINSCNKRDTYMSAELADGIFAKVKSGSSKIGIIPRSLTFSNLKMEINSIGKGAEILTAMSPKPDRRRLETVPGASRNSGSMESVYCTASENFDMTFGSSTEFEFDDRNVDVKKRKHETYKYTIKYRELDEAKIGHFNTSMEDGSCEILVCTRANVAMVAIVVAFYYQQKCKKIRTSRWRNPLSINRGFTKVP